MSINLEFTLLLGGIQSAICSKGIIPKFHVK